MELHDELEKAGCDVTLLEIEDADHADIRFFQKEIWQEIITFLKQNYKKKTAADSSKMEKWRILLSEKWAYSRKLFAICHFQPICVYKLPPRYYSQGLAKFIKLDKQDVHHQCHTVCSLNNGWQDNLPCQGSYLSSYRSPLERHQVLRHENRG